MNNNELKHVGVLGMKWGHRKSEDMYKTEGFTIKKGSTLHRISTISNETNKGSGYASFLSQDSEKYKKMGQVFSKFGMNNFDMTMKAKKDLISPSQKERIDVFLEKIKDPEFSKELNKTRARMLILNIPTPHDISLTRHNKNLTLSKAITYRLLNASISGNKVLREQYLNEFKKRNYDFILDETDSSTKQAIAPIIFIERANSLDVVNVEKL